MTHNQNAIIHDGEYKQWIAALIESKLWQREGKALSNFSKALPAPQSDLAHQTLKDPYVFDFLRLAKDND